MDKILIPQFLLPGDSLRLRKNRLKHIRKRNWIFFRKIGAGRILLMNERQPLLIHARNVDWETFRKKGHPMRKTSDQM